jgi:ubiquitin carboxyl-terminal hydrolase 8
MASESEIKTKIMSRGLSGLVNVGNTCYMNSGLQCLSACNMFLSYFLKKSFINDLKDNLIENYKKEQSKDPKYREIKINYTMSITYNYYKLLSAMWFKNREIVPESFKKFLGYHCKTFRGTKQQDSQEFINTLLDLIHEETKRKVNIKIRQAQISEEVCNYIGLRRSLVDKNNNATTDEERIEAERELNIFLENNQDNEIYYNSLIYWTKYMSNNYSIVTQLFTGLYSSIVTCLECKTKSASFEPFNILQLPIPEKEKATLKECLDDYTKTEKLDDDNKFHCSKCSKKVDSEKRLTLWNTPAYLIIQLKRFRSDVRSRHKVNTYIDYPLKDLSLEDNFNEQRKRNYKYDLIGIVRHMGSLDGGHYVAYTKNPINNLWYYFDDSKVRGLVEVDDFSEIEKIIQTKEAYILFYKKQNNIEDK